MSQADTILELLQERGPKGASNFELMKISYQYPARIYTLRHKLGHDISITHVKNKEWRVVLKDEKVPARVAEKNLQSDEERKQAAVEPVEPRLQDIGVWKYKGHTTRDGAYVKGSKYSMTIEKPEIGLPIKVLLPIPIEYRNLRHFKDNWSQA